MLVPDLELVLVTTSNSTPHTDRRSHRRALQDLLEQDIIINMARFIQATPQTAD
jgi:hypothetical protein